jgi:TPR repeat protein
MMYAAGQGVEKDKAKAVFFMQKAADQGDSDAEYFLGQMYERGEGVEQDLTQARQWYQRAANQGHEAAQTRLAELFSACPGVTQVVVEEQCPVEENEGITAQHPGG